MAFDGPMPSHRLLLTGHGRLCMAWPMTWKRPATLSPWAVGVEDDRISWVGSPENAAAAPSAAKRIDLGDALVTPGLVDSHTHPIFAGDRSDEAAARLEGVAYSGGGILRTTAATRAADDAALEALVEHRLQGALAAGTTTVECKSGYGLSLAEELRQLRLLRRVSARVPVRVVPTFLGAHAVPPEAASAGEYARHVAAEMIPAVAGEELAAFVDVFVERGFFSVPDARRVLEAARTSSLGLKLHAEQMSRTHATELGIRLGVTSVDHLEQLDAAGVGTLAASTVIATLLPGPALVMRDRLPPARALLDAGARVALASDANAGTFGAFGAMPMVIGLGATLLGMTIGEALAAATAGGAAAIGKDDLGVVRAGAHADLVAWDAEHEGAFALRMGDVRPLRIWIGGTEVGLTR